MKFIYSLLTLIAFSANAQQIQTLNWDDARINGNLELTILKRDFEKAVKGIGTIAKPAAEDVCANNEELDIQFYSYKGLTYEIDNGVLNFRRVLFDKKSGIYFLYKDIKFDGTSTPATLFSLINKEATTSTEKDTPKGKYIIISLDEKSDEGQWQFHFKDGKLVSIHCIFNC
jgi:hypothetical protein